MDYYKNLVLDLHRPQFFFYFLKPIEEIIYNIKTSKNILFKDLLIQDSCKEYLYEFYDKEDSEMSLKIMSQNFFTKWGTPLIKSDKNKLLLKAKYKKIKRKNNAIEEKLQIKKQIIRKKSILKSLNDESEYIESIDQNEKNSKDSNLETKTINNIKDDNEYSSDYYDIYNSSKKLNFITESKIIKKIKIPFNFNESKYNEIVLKQLKLSRSKSKLSDQDLKLKKKILNKKKKIIKTKNLKKCNTLRDYLNKNNGSFNKKFSTKKNNTFNKKKDKFSLNYFSKTKKSFPNYLNKIVNTFIFPNNKVNIKGSLNIIKKQCKSKDKNKLKSKIIKLSTTPKKKIKKNYYLFSPKKNKDVSLKNNENEKKRILSKIRKTKNNLKLNFINK